MKHLFNFVPTEKYREGSSFLYKTILVVMYGIPIIIALFNLYEYLAVSAVREYLASFVDKFEAHRYAFQKKLSERKIDKEEFNLLMNRALGYYHSLTPIQFSWTALLEDIETMLPKDVRLVRLHLNPAKFVKISMEGETLDLGKLTEFLRRLFKHPKFFNPHLNYHRVNQNKDSAVSFSFGMTVDYFPFLESVKKDPNNYLGVNGQSE